MRSESSDIAFSMFLSVVIISEMVGSVYGISLLVCLVLCSVLSCECLSFGGGYDE